MHARDNRMPPGPLVRIRLDLARHGLDDARRRGMDDLEDWVNAIIDNHFVDKRAQRRQGLGYLADTRVDDDTELLL